MQATTAPDRTGALGRLALEGGGLLLAAPLWLWWAVWKGGYEPSIFLPAIAYLAFAALVLHLWAPRPPLSRPVAVALAGLGALSVWSVLSLIWADDGGAAEIAAGRQVLLLASFALPALWPPTTRMLLLGLGALTLSALAGGISALGEVLGDPEALLDGRLVGPTGYANASAALFAAGGLPALAIASRRESGPAVRAGAIAAAGVLAGLFVLTQSRGGVGALVVAVLIAFALMPGRLRFAVPIAIVAVGVLVILDPLLEVRRVAVGVGDLGTAIDDAVRALGLLAAALVPVGLLYAFADARIDVKPRVGRAVSRAVGALLVGAALAGAVALVVSGPDPVEWVFDRVDDFKTPDYSRLESQDTRFTGDLGSNRYDYWRASVEIFSERPLTGSGAGNFIGPYLEIRESDISTIYAHSVWLGTLGELGALGILALLTFAGALALAIVRRIRAAGTDGWVVAAASLPFVYVLVHASADWVGAFPVVAAPAFGLAGAAVAVGRAEPVTVRRGARSSSTWFVVGLVACAVAAMPLFLAARWSDRGAATWPERPDAALRDLERAADLDPLAPAPDVRRGVIAIELGRHGVAAEAFEAALERDPTAWYPRFQLGVLAGADGRFGAAMRHLAAAARLNPREPEIRRARRALALGRTFDPLATQRRVLGRSSDG
jgi:hypothetical protein